MKSGTQRHRRQQFRALYFATAAFFAVAQAHSGIDAGAFPTRIEVPTQGGQINVALADIDGDGKIDAITPDYSAGTLSLYRNISPSGIVSASSFAPAVRFPCGSQPVLAKVGDIDGDGKLDIVVVNNSSRTISVFRNVAEPGSLTTNSLASKVDLATASDPRHCAIGDLDGDGKLDIALVAWSSSKLSFFRNLSITGAIMFGARSDFPSVVSSVSIECGDIDGDGNPDLVVGNLSLSSVSVFRNKGTGELSASLFSEPVMFAAGSGSTVSLGDVDGDGKLDIVAPNQFANTISVLRNLSSLGAVVFGPKVDFQTGTYPYSAIFVDADNDGKLDIAVANTTSRTVSLFRNVSSPGEFTSASLNSRIDFSVGVGPRIVSKCDLDGDGRDDLVTGNLEYSAFTVLASKSGENGQLEFRLGGDFSPAQNPSGPWTYGWSETVGGALTKLTTPRTSMADNGVPVQSWQLSSYQEPAVFVNTGTNRAVFQYGTAYGDPGEAWFFPGQNGRSENYGVIRFTAPSNSNYEVSSLAYPLYPAAGQGDTDFHIVKNGVSLLDRWLSGSQSAGYTGVVALAANDSVDFVIGRGLDGLQNESGLKISAFIAMTTNAPTPELPPVVTNACELAAVLPPAFATRDGGAASGSGMLTQPGRYHTIYGSNLFPSQRIMINEIRYRPSAYYGHAFTTTVSNLEIRLSTTARQPEGLSATFASNVGSDEAVVFSGTIVLSSSFAGPTNGPKQFDIRIPLATPFAYDAARGNLLVDLRNPVGSGAALLDHASVAGDSAGRSFGSLNSATAGTVDPGADVAQFGYCIESNAPPLITSQPVSGIVIAGGSASFEVHAVGSGTLTYQWQFNGDPISGAVLPLLELANVQPAQAGNYSVRVGNAYGAVLSSNATLTVTSVLAAPAITSISPSRTVTAGTRVVLSVLATGSVPLRYQWRFNGVNIPAGTNSSYILASAQVGNTGNYSVLVQNNVGSATSDDIALAVEELASAPSFASQPLASVNTEVGDSISLSVVVNGTPPLVYQWLFNGQAIDGAIGPVLPLGDVQVTTAGVYAVRVSNQYGSITSAGTTLSVQTTNQGTLLFANASDSRVFDVNGTNPVPASAQYLVELLGGSTADALSPVPGATRFVFPGRFNGGIRTVPGMQAGQTAYVQFRVWDSFAAATYNESVLAGAKHGISAVGQVQLGGGIAPPGSVSATQWPSFHLVEGLPPVPPVIATQPVSQSVPLGAPASLSVSATGVGLTYQWLFNGTVKPGAASATLAFGGASLADAGEYAVVVSNGGGSVTSQVAALEVRVDRGLSLEVPEAASQGNLVSVPVILESDGSVGGMTFVLNFDPDYLAGGEVTWGDALSGALTQASAPAPGQVRGVCAVSSGTIPAGTQLVATVTFRARTVLSNAFVNVDLTLADVSTAEGDPLLFGNVARGGSIEITGQGSFAGDLNSNGRLDVGDANLMLRLLAQIDTLRPWDVPQSDLNANAALDSGDVIKVLRASTGIDSQPVAAATVRAAKTGSSLTLERGLITPAVVRGTAANTVLVQVLLQDMRARISGAQFTLSYATNALRVISMTSLRVGSMVPSSAYTVWNNTRGRVTFGASSATDWSASNGVLAEIGFEIQPGATNQFAWPLVLGGMEVTSGGLNRPVTPTGSTFIARDPRTGTLGRMSRAADGQFRFDVSGDANCDYVIESSTDLKTWNPIQTLNSGTGLIQFNDPDAASRPHTFYRARPVSP